MNLYHDTILPVNGRFAVDREFVYIAVPLLKHFVGASSPFGSHLAHLGSHLADLGAKMCSKRPLN